LDRLGDAIVKRKARVRSYVHMVREIRTERKWPLYFYETICNFSTLCLTLVFLCLSFPLLSPFSHDFTLLSLYALFWPTPDINSFIQNNALRGWGHRGYCPFCHFLPLAFITSQKKREFPLPKYNIPLRFTLFEGEGGSHSKKSETLSIFI